MASPEPIFTASRPFFSTDHKNTAQFGAYCLKCVIYSGGHVKKLRRHAGFFRWFANNNGHRDPRGCGSVVERSAAMRQLASSIPAQVCWRLMKGKLDSTVNAATLWGAEWWGASHCYLRQKGARQISENVKGEMTELVEFYQTEIFL